MSLAPGTGIDGQLLIQNSIADVHDLDKFTQLNYVGFQKILKKHDVRIDAQLWECMTLVSLDI